MWNGRTIAGEWTISYKVDGVRALIKNGVALSRAGKPLHNLAHLPDGDFEVFFRDWSTSVSLVRTEHSFPVPLEYAYSLEPLDARLHGGIVVDPTPDMLRGRLQDALAAGYEGLVLRQGEVRLKLKPEDTYDVPVIGLLPGKGKHLGRLGALLTPRGKVGTGFSDAERVTLQTLPVGTVIEVRATGLTPGGKFRHPRFVRVRFDKEASNQR